MITNREVCINIENIVEVFCKNPDVDKTFHDLKSFHDQAQLNDTDYNDIYDIVFRQAILSVVSEPDGCGDGGFEATDDTAITQRVHALVSLCIQLARQQMCVITLPITLLSDAFDCLCLSACQQLFAFVEEHVSVWKEPLFFSACKNNLLRVCNDLLKRISRSQNTVFCGHILMFLARFFPLSERSGLNVVSEFNLDNLTDFDQSSEVCDDESIITGTDFKSFDNSNTKVGYNLYRKLWILQDYFRNPNQCYSTPSWRAFTMYTTDVLNVFSGYNFESVNNFRTLNFIEDKQYFAKYLTSQKLLHLQLSDITFQRFFLVQFLIVFQYLTCETKFKHKDYKLDEEQKQWIINTRTQIHNMLRRMTTNGDVFLSTIIAIIKRENEWNKWKNDGCPELKVERPADSASGQTTSPYKRRARKRVGEILAATDAKKKFLMGKPELTRIWNVCPDNLQSCKSKDRNFLPSLEHYFKQSVQQMDSASMVEDQYKQINDTNFGWRALRLLARRSTHFFAASQKIPNSLPEYLDTTLKKLVVDFPSLVEQTSKPRFCENEATDAPLDHNATCKQLHGVSEALVATLSQQLASTALDWKLRLAPRLGFESDMINFICEESDCLQAQIKLLLLEWIKKEGVDASQEELVYVLTSTKLMSQPIRALFDATVVSDQ